MGRLSLVKYFTVFSLIAFILTGTVLGFFISNHIRNDMLDNITEITGLSLNAFLVGELKPIDFTKPFSKEKIRILDEKFKQIKNDIGIVSIKIWDRSGTILYSDKTDTIGQHFSVSNALYKALSNSSQLEIIKPDKVIDKDLSKQYNEVIVLYEPIKYNGKVTGVYEVYIPYDEVKRHMNTLNKTIAFIMFIGLVILYLLLLKIIGNASRTLIQQNESLLKQKYELEESYLRLNSSYQNTVMALSSAVDARDSYTSGHSERVTKLSMALGKRMYLSKNQLENLELAARFHDIGKLGIPDSILMKAGKLTCDEFEVIKSHPQIGVSILGNIEFLKDAIPIILHHHERFCGGGYPSGIQSYDIPLESRIIALADTYDAMTSDRPYRKGLSHEATLDEIRKNKGVQFDPEIVECFLLMFR